MLNELADIENLVWQIDGDVLAASDYKNLMQVFYDEVKLKDGVVLQGEQYSLSEQQTTFWGDVYSANGDDYVDYTLVSLETSSDYTAYMDFLSSESVNKPTWLLFEIANMDYANSRLLWEELVSMLASDVEVLVFSDVDLLDSSSSRLMSYFVLEFLHGLIAEDYVVSDKGVYFEFETGGITYKVRKSIAYNWSGQSGLEAGLDYLGNEVSDLSEADVAW